jgi:hypothetical protein
VGAGSSGSTIRGLELLKPGEHRNRCTKPALGQQQRARGELTTEAIEEPTRLKWFRDGQRWKI